MSRTCLGSFLKSRLSITVLACIVLVRIYQCFSLDERMFSADNNNLFAFIYLITPLQLAAFVLAPLYLIFTSQVLRATDKTLFLVRLKYRESIVYRFALLLLLHSLIFAAITHASAFIVLLLKSPYTFDIGDLAFGMITTTLFSSLFFFVCAMLQLLVYTGTGKPQLAIIAMLAYVVWDFIVDHIPVLSDQLPALGWRLTEIHYPVSSLGLFISFSVFLSMIAVLIFASLLVFRNKDIIHRVSE